MITIKTPEEIVKLRTSADILVQTFLTLAPYVQPGITTGKLDEIAEEAILSRGAEPAFKGYRGFPATICASIDNQVVHGIPGDRVLKNGEILSLDIGVFYNGYYSDASRTYPVGDITPEKQVLIDITKQALYRGIKKCRAGNRLSDISHSIQSCVESRGFSPVRDLVGHGIGKSLHEEPQIPNYGQPHQGPKLKAGMVFAIEPMINMGSSAIKVLQDGWTVETKDGLPSAHFEHTVLVTNGKPEILTLGIEGNDP